MDPQTLFPELTPEAAAAALELNRRRSGAPPLPGAVQQRFNEEPQNANEGVPSPPLPAGRQQATLMGPPPPLPGPAGAGLIPEAVAAFAGHRGYISPGRANGDVVGNANGVVASRVGPERRLSEAEYNALQRNPNQSFPSYQSLQTGGANAPAIPGIAPNERALSYDEFVRQVHGASAAAGDTRMTPSPSDYEHYLNGQIQRNQINQQMQIERSRAMGIPAIGGNPAVPGAIQNAAQAIENAGNITQMQREAAGRDAYRSALNRSMAEHPERSPNEHNIEAEATSGVTAAQYNRMITPRAQGGIPGQASQQSASQSTGDNPPVSPEATASALRAAAVDAARRGNDVSRATPWAEIESHLNRASGFTPARPAQGNTPAVAESMPKDATVGGFIGKLESNNPGMLATHLPEIVAYMRSKFGDATTDRELRRSDSVLQIRVPNNPLDALIQSVPNIFTRARQVAVGPSDEENGLSALGQLRAAVDRAGGHPAFMRGMGGR